MVDKLPYLLPVEGTGVLLLEVLVYVESYRIPPLALP